MFRAGNYHHFHLANPNHINNSLNSPCSPTVKLVHKFTTCQSDLGLDDGRLRFFVQCLVDPDLREVDDLIDIYKEDEGVYHIGSFGDT